VVMTANFSGEYTGVARIKLLTGSGNKILTVALRFNASATKLYDYLGYKVIAFSTGSSDFNDSWQVGLLYTSTI